MKYSKPFDLFLLTLMQFIMLALVLKYTYKRLDNAQPLCVEAYTCEDIYYLRGNRVTSESGKFDVTFETPNEAIEFFSGLTSDDAKRNCHVHGN